MGAGRGASLDGIPGVLAAPATSRAAQLGPPGGREAMTATAVGLPVLGLRDWGSWRPQAVGALSSRLEEGCAVRTQPPRLERDRAGASLAGPVKAKQSHKLLPTPAAAAAGSRAPVVLHI